ncbi:MAG: GGDEF domain-containing protein [Xanthomonadales bacterium]|nr:GGDEF domain-containing protein [Xanthomonadales bacterium]
MNPIIFILIALVLICAMLCIIFVIAWRSFGRQQYALTWATLFGAGTIQWLMNIFSRDLFDDRRYFWLLADLLGLVVMTLGLAGYRQRAGLPTRTGLLVAIAGVAWGLIFCFLFLYPHHGLRQAVVPFYAPIALGWAALILLRKREPVLPAEWGAATVMILFSLSQILAGSAALMQGAESEDYWRGVYLAINFSALPAAYAGTGLFAVFILASDLSEQMKQLARTDQLTQLLNRRGFAEAAAYALGKARRLSQPLSVVLVDIDHFKRINDQYGHAAGDQVLTAFATHLGTQKRQQDLLARIGGEEFVLVLDGIEAAQAGETAEGLRQGLRQLELQVDGQALTLTASFGVAALLGSDSDLYDTIKRADSALYQAKQAGRDRSVVAE